jgi:hypothetical protein
MESFRELERKRRRESPNLFKLASPDNPASLEQLQLVERALGASLPNDLRMFLHEYGGGECGYLTLFSADPTSEWYLPRKMEEAKKYLPDGLLPISDDFCGGYYVLVVRNGNAEEPVCYWNADGGTTSTEFKSLLDFIGRFAFESA